MIISLEKKFNGIILEGRDCGSEVAPEADFHVNQNEAHSSTYYLDSDINS